ncbi:MAG: histidine kinase dimerization/phospho-acceptor domain-containing protein, partial [Burkholderiaceae bacterium]
MVWYGYESRLIDRVVSDELRRSVELFPREPALAYPNTDDLTLYVVSRDPAVPGDVLPSHLERLRDIDVPDGPRIVIRETTVGDGIEYHVGIARRGDRTFLLAYDACGHAERRSALLWSVIAIAALLTFVASRLALHLVDRLLAGLSRLQTRIAASGMNGRFLDDDMDVEIAALASALDTQRGQVIAALRKERAFAAAASHELRTPLTRIATGAELLLAQPGLAGP